MSREAAFKTVLILILLLFVFGVIALEFNDSRRAKVCQDAGYVGLDEIDGQIVCYGYVEQDKLVVIDFKTALVESQ